MRNNCSFIGDIYDEFPFRLMYLLIYSNSPACLKAIFTEYYYVIINCIIPYTSILNILTGIPLIVLLKWKVKPSNYYLNYWGIFILFCHIVYFIITLSQWLCYRLYLKALSISSNFMCKFMSSLFRFITYIQFNSTILIISRELLVYKSRFRQGTNGTSPSYSIFWLILILAILLSIIQTIPSYFVNQLKCTRHNPTNRNATLTVDKCQCIIQPVWLNIFEEYNYWYKLHRVIFSEGILPITCLIGLSVKLWFKIQFHNFVLQSMRYDVSSGNIVHSTLQEVFNNTLGDSNNLKILYIYTLALIISSLVYCFYYTLIYFAYSMNVEYNILHYYLEDIPLGLLFIDALALVIRTISYNIFIILWYTYIPEINTLGHYLWCKLITKVYIKCMFILRRSSDPHLLQYQHSSRYYRRKQRRHSKHQTSYQSYQSHSLPKVEYYYGRVMNRSKERLNTLISQAKLGRFLKKTSLQETDSVNH